MEIKVKIPENLDITQLLQDAGIVPKGNIVDKIAFVCYSIHLSTVNHRDYFESKDRPYFPVCASILQKYIHDYKSIETLLKDNGVIECDGIYRKQLKCFGYRFTEQYYGQKLKEHEIVTVGLHNKIQDYLTHDPLPAYPIPNSYLFLKKFWADGKLKMDVAGAMKWIDATYQTDINYLNYHFTKQVQDKQQTAKKAAQKKEVVLKRLTEKIEIWKTSVENFNIGRTIFTVDDFSKRLHTKLTNLKKELRGFITYDGKQLVSLDIKNSQPYLALVLFNTDFWKDRAKPNLKTLIYRVIGLDKIKEEVRYRICNTIKLAEISESASGKGFEFDQFMTLVTSGKLYEFFIEQFKDAGFSSVSRDAIKRYFLTYLFYNPNDEGQSRDKGVQLITEIFPNISALFLQLKQPRYKPLYQFPFHVLKAKESYKFPPQLLQRIESYLVIEAVCNQLKKGNKNIPLFTIHDSIVTTLEFEQIVNDKMKLELTNAIGFEPKIHPEYYAPLPAIIKTDFTAKEITELNDELF